MIAIIDYGMGNLKSVQNALDHLGYENRIVSDPQALSGADHLILPGVGAFPDCMKNLEDSGMIPIIKDEVAKGTPLLGICLGMQVLFESSEEVSMTKGLGLLKGTIVKMQDPTVKIPHIGWNALDHQDNQMLAGLHHPYVYYVHSYYAQGYEEQDLVATSTYGSLTIPGAFRKGNLWATQFHPEKSGEDGLTILRNFVEGTR